MRTMRWCEQSRIVRRLLLLGALGALGLLGAMGAIEARAATIFRDDAARFTFLVPDGWARDDSDSASAGVSFLSMRPVAEFDLNVFDAGGEGSLDLLVAATARELARSFDDFRLVQTLPTKLGDENAQQIDYTATVGDASLSFSLILSLHDGSVYALTISAAPEDIEAFAQQERLVLQSWAFA